MELAGFKPEMPTSVQPQNHALDRAATGTDEQENFGAP
jgi:hypothetical protein